MWAVENMNFWSLLSFWFQEWLRQQKNKESETSPLPGTSFVPSLEFSLEALSRPTIQSLGPCPLQFYFVL